VFRERKRLGHGTSFRRKEKKNPKGNMPEGEKEIRHAPNFRRKGEDSLNLLRRGDQDRQSIHSEPKGKQAEELFLEQPFEAIVLCVAGKRGAKKRNA